MAAQLGGLGGWPASQAAVLVTHVASSHMPALPCAPLFPQNEMWLEKQERMRALDHHHHQHFAAEQHKLARLALLEQQQERMPSVRKPGGLLAWQRCAACERQPGLARRPRSPHVRPPVCPLATVEPG